jgi:hypothetical protein
VNNACEKQLQDSLKTALICCRNNLSLGLLYKWNRDVPIGGISKILNVMKVQNVGEADINHPHKNSSINADELRLRNKLSSIFQRDNADN